jgi:hypothetical protein
MPLMQSITKLARSPQARRLAQQAIQYAQSPEGKRRIAAARQQLERRRRRKP